jgi:hypothetical protein
METDSDLVVAKVGLLAAKHAAAVDLLPIVVVAIDVPNNAPPVWHLFALEESCPPAEDASLATQKVVAEEGHPYIHSNCHDPCLQEEAHLVCTFPSAGEHPALAAIQLQVLHTAEAVVGLAIPCMPHSVACAHRMEAVLRTAAAERDVAPRTAVLGGIQEEARSYFLAFLLLGQA